MARASPLHMAIGLLRWWEVDSVTATGSLNRCRTNAGLASITDCPILGLFDPTYTLPTSATTDGATINA